MRVLVVMLLLASCLAFAKGMPEGSDNYALVEKIFTALQLNSSNCDQTALEDPVSEWRCASYAQDYASFIPLWQAMLTQYRDIPLLAISKWRYLAQEDGSVDFYARAYQLPTSQLIIAYDPSESGREVFIGMSENIGRIMQHTTGKVNLETMALEVDAPKMNMTDLLIGALMSDFLNVPAEATEGEASFTTEPLVSETATETSTATANETVTATPTPPRSPTAATANANPYTTPSSNQAASSTLLFIDSPNYNYCAGFSHQQAAQEFYHRHNFSLDYDPYNLDENKNGVACEGSDL